MPQTTYDIAAQVEAVNALLKSGEPGNISTDNSASYASFTGYKPQAIIDAMNEVFGYGNWGFEEISNEALMGAEKGGLTISQVRVFLKDCAFQPTGWGQARITKGDIGDAKKGAQTDALKKALSYFSIGNRAYHGLLPVTQEGQGQNQQASRQQRSPAVQPPQVQNKPQVQQNAERRQDTGSASDQQLASIQKLAAHLGGRVYDVPKTYQQAKELLATLSQEYRQRRESKVQ